MKIGFDSSSQRKGKDKIPIKARGYTPFANHFELQNKPLSLK